MCNIGYAWAAFLLRNNTGGCFTQVSSSLGNFQPFFLKASPKLLSSGKLL
jgi:hypothetical protein